MTPGIRIAAVAASGVASLRFGTFLRGLVVGNTVFVAAHFGFGFLVGAPALYIGRELTGPVVALVAFAVLAAIGAAGWLLIRGRLAEGMGGTPVFDEWADCSCPACLTISALNGAGRASPAKAE